MPCTVYWQCQWDAPPVWDRSSHFVKLIFVGFLLSIYSAIRDPRAWAMKTRSLSKFFADLVNMMTSTKSPSPNIPPNMRVYQILELEGKFLDPFTRTLTSNQAISLIDSSLFLVPTWYHWWLGIDSVPGTLYQYKWEVMWGSVDPWSGKARRKNGESHGGCSEDIVSWLWFFYNDKVGIRPFIIVSNPFFSPSMLF